MAPHQVDSNFSGHSTAPSGMDIPAPAARCAGSSWSRLARAFGRYLERRRTIGQLSALSDRELADIGLRREEIRLVVDDGASFAGGRSRHVSVLGEAGCWPGQNRR